MVIKAGSSLTDGCLHTCHIKTPKSLSDPSYDDDDDNEHDDEDFYDDDSISVPSIGFSGSTEVESVPPVLPPQGAIPASRRGLQKTKGTLWVQPGLL